MLINVKYSCNFILQKKNINDFYSPDLRRLYSAVYSLPCTFYHLQQQDHEPFSVHRQGMGSLKSYETADVVSLGERIEDKIEKSKEM